ncbi:MAG: TfoX/Sxy family protein [Candidatus Paceibacterota bacterium]
MTYSEALAERIRHQLVGRTSMDEKKMFGGLGFFLNGNMCVGVWKESLVARVGPKQYDQALQEPFVSEFDITERAMSGWVLVAQGTTIG